MTKEKIEKIIKGAKTEKTIIKRLNDNKIKFENASSESGYLNVRIPTNSGNIRIYKNGRKDIVVQVNTKVKFEYSGIPVFFANPSYF